MQRADHEFDRRLDQHRALVGGVERIAGEQQAQRGANVVAGVTQDGGNACDLGGVGLGRHELAPQLADDELGAGRLRQQHIEHVIAIEVAGASEHGLVATVVLKAAEHESAIVGVEAPAGESPRGLLHVALAVAAFAEREEFHDLAREILVRLGLAVLRVVEIDEHGRIARHRVQQGGEVAHRMLPQQQVLAQHQHRRLDLGLRRHEVVVPEQRHALGEGRWCVEHLAQPPGAQLHAGDELLRDDSLALVVGQRLDVAGANELVQCRGDRRDRGGAHPLEQPGDRLLAAKPGVATDFGVGGAEPGAGEQMARGGVIQRRCRKHAATADQQRGSGRPLARDTHQGATPAQLPPLTHATDA